MCAERSRTALRPLGGRSFSSDINTTALSVFPCAASPAACTRPASPGAMRHSFPQRRPSAPRIFVGRGLSHDTKDDREQRPPLRRLSRSMSSFPAITLPPIPPIPQVVIPSEAIFADEGSAFSWHRQSCLCKSAFSQARRFGLSREGLPRVFIPGW